MRRILAATLVLLPVLANAQARTTTEPQPSQTSATLVAKSTPPAALLAAKNAASTDGMSAAATPAGPIAVNMIIHQIDPETMVSSAPQNGSLSYTFGNDNAITPPQLIHVVPTDLAPQQMSKRSDVAVHLTVDANGTPRNIMLDHATDPVVAQKTIAAVSQYRFKPAMRNYLAVPADVTVDVKIK